MNRKRYRVSDEWGVYYIYEEIAELESLSDSIDPGDVLLLEWAGVPEKHP